MNYIDIAQAEELYGKAIPFHDEDFTKTRRKLINAIANGLKGKADLSLFAEGKDVITSRLSKFATDILWEIESRRELKEFARDQAIAKHRKHLERYPSDQQEPPTGIKTYQRYVVQIAFDIVGDIREDFRSDISRYPFNNHKAIEDMVSVVLARHRRDREAMRTGRERHLRSEQIARYRSVQEVS